MTDTARIIAALQGNAQKLLEQNWVEAWSYRALDRPLKLTMQHIIDPTQDGGYRVKTSVAFGIRVSHGLEADLQASANDNQKLSSFPTRRDVAA